jgi:hypothetical protein
MVLILLSLIVAAILVAISMMRHRISFGSFARSGIAREDIAVARERPEQSSAMKQFLIVVLPDGRVVNPSLADQL